MWRRNGARRIATRTASAIAALTVIAAGTAGGAAAKAPAGAAQGPPQSPAAVPGGYKLVHSGFISAPNGTRPGGEVLCPATSSGVTRRPQGGGVLITSGSLFVNIGETFPISTGWAGVIDNVSGADTTFQIWALCAKPHTGYSQVESGPIPLGAGTQVPGFEPCPSGTKILGGGGVAAGSANISLNINSSYPVNNGWHVDMNNGSTTDTGFAVWAVCSRYSISKTGYGVHVGTSVINPAGMQTFASVDCPSGQVPLGGGALSSSGLTSVNMNSTYPTQGPAGSAQGWGVYENNASASNHSITPYVICAS